MSNSNIPIEDRIRQFRSPGSAHERVYSSFRSELLQTISDSKLSVYSEDEIYEKFDRAMLSAFKIPCSKDRQYAIKLVEMASESLTGENLYD